MDLRDWPPHRDVVSHDRPRRTCLWNYGGHLSSKAGLACLPACLPTCLQNFLGKWRPDTNPAWIGASLLPTTHEGGWALTALQEGTWDPSLSHHVLRLGDSTLGTLYRNCFPQNWCCFIQLPKLSCPRPLDRTIRTPLPLQSVSVAELTHHTGLMVVKASTINPSEQHSRCYRRCYCKNKDSASLGDAE